MVNIRASPISETETELSYNISLNDSMTEGIIKIIEKPIKRWKAKIKRFNK